MVHGSGSSVTNGGPAKAVSEPPSHNPANQPRQPDVFLRLDFIFPAMRPG
jgi:hypothetical protein